MRAARAWAGVPLSGSDVVWSERRALRERDGLCVSGAELVDGVRVGCGEDEGPYGRRSAAVPSPHGLVDLGLRRGLRAYAVRLPGRRQQAPSDWYGAFAPRDCMAQRALSFLVTADRAARFRSPRRHRPGRLQPPPRRLRRRAGAFPMARLRPRQQAQGDAPRRRRVHPTLPPARAPAPLYPAAPLRIAGQSRARSQARPVSNPARSANPRTS